MVSQIAEPVVAVRGLVKVFKDFWMRARARAVDGVTFEVRRGEVFGLLGPNGSGKSTTIKVMLGLLHRSGGHVAVFGKPPSDVAVKKRIGYLPEESYLYPFLNARETLDYYAKLFGLDARQRKRRVDELLEMVGLTGAQFRPVREYSKGMQRRIGIAQALINDPELLILDEPTTGLDPIGCRQIKDLIISLGRRGKSVLLSSHLLADVEDCVDRMVILYGGKVRAEGTCDSLLTTQDRRIIETDALDEATLTAVDEFIRSRTAGASSVTRVSKPRQRLEDLFIDIVERARAEQVATSGAFHGGKTASFLTEPVTGERLIDELMRAESVAAKPAVPPDAEAARDDVPRVDVLGELLGAPQPAAASDPSSSGPPASTPARPAGAGGGRADSAGAGPPQPRSSPDVDRGMLDSLLGRTDTPERPS